MEKTTKRRRGDRKDGVLLRNLDGMHFITPIIYPNRCDNEAYISETIDLTNMNAYLQKKNAQSVDFPYTMFHIIVAALIKTITLRPKMNRFIANKNFYQRNGVSASFVVKKQFADEAAEALAVVRGKDESTLDTIHEDLRHQIMDCKDMTKTDTSTDFMDIFNRMPRWLVNSSSGFSRGSTFTAGFLRRSLRQTPTTAQSSFRTSARSSCTAATIT